ncbi:MAG: DUF4105 domain-containing protein [Gemmatimonadetes bacterium]|nr:DUF4105 domain-containing protein [Gemmatimonadota bacterium]
MLRKVFIGALLFVICVVPLYLITSVPRSHRLYVPEHDVLPYVRLLGRQAQLGHVRSYRYAADGGMTVRYFDRTYDLDAVRRVWFGISPFGSWHRPAPVFVSFEFADSQYLAISVEARREPGETYSPWLGMLRRYELMYVVADEPDVIGVRSVGYRDQVYLYPGKATPTQAAHLLETLLERAADLRRRPEYYHTLANNGATNLADAVNEVAPGRVPWSRALVMPALSDEYAFELGLLGLERRPAEVRTQYRVDQRARAANGASDFSQRIRHAVTPSRGSRDAF